MVEHDMIYSVLLRGEIDAQVNLLRALTSWEGKMDMSHPRFERKTCTYMLVDKNEYDQSKSFSICKMQY